MHIGYKGVTFEKVPPPATACVPFFSSFFSESAGNMARQADYIP